MLAVFAALVVLYETDAIPPETLEACVGTRTLAAPMERIAEAKAEATSASWLAACQEARQAEQARQRLVATALSTEGVPAPGYERAGRYARLAADAGSPEVAELYRRMARDAAARNSLPRATRNTFAPTISPLGEMLLLGLISNAAVESDADNTKWLKATIKSRGWFTNSRDGPEADLAAWTIVQHSDEDRDFQRFAIGVIEPLAVRGESSKVRFSLLYDRWAARANQPLRFGLQGRCVAAGRWEPWPIEDPEAVENRRKEFGLEPLTEQINVSSRRCLQASK